MRCTMINVSAIPSDETTRDPIVTCLNGPKTKEIDKKTRTRVDIGCNNFFQNAIR